MNPEPEPCCLHCRHWTLSRHLPELGTCDLLKACLALGDTVRDAEQKLGMSRPWSTRVWPWAAVTATTECCQHGYEFLPRVIRRGRPRVC